MVVAINKFGNGNNEGCVKGYEGLKQPFTKLTVCILMSYGIFVKGEGRSSSSLQCITKQVLALLLLRSSVVEEAVDVGVTVKILCLIDPKKIRVTGDAYNWKQKFQKTQNENICLIYLNTEMNGNYHFLSFCALFLKVQNQVL